MFYSTFTNRLDAKGRMSFPASWRKALSKNGEKSILLRSDFEEKMLEGMSPERMDKIAESLDDETQYPLGDSTRLNLAKLAISQFRRLDFDSEGRIMLPQGHIKSARLKQTAVLVGMGMTLQIWEPGNWERWSGRTMEAAQKRRIDFRLKPPSEQKR